MKLGRLTRFPYPVLESFTDDYKTGEFSVGVEISEAIKTGALLVRYDVKLTEEGILGYIGEGSAKVCLFVTCLETYYNQIHEISIPDGYLEIGKGLLAGNVRLLPLVVLSGEHKRIRSANFHEEFMDREFMLEEGSVIAIGDEYRINVGMEKLAPIESIFNLAISDLVPPGQFNVNLDDEKINILAETNTYRAIYDIRNTSPGKSVILNSVYLPALMEVLSALQQDSGTYMDKHWFKVFSAKCTHLNIDLGNVELLRDSQKLLKSPFNKVVSLMRELD